jgi:hypothetical protein
MHHVAYHLTLLWGGGGVLQGTPGTPARTARRRTRRGARTRRSTRARTPRGSRPSTRATRATRRLHTRATRGAGSVVQLETGVHRRRDIRDGYEPGGELEIAVELETGQYTP